MGIHERARVHPSDHPASGAPGISAPTLLPLLMGSLHAVGGGVMTLAATQPLLSCARAHAPPQSCLRQRILTEKEDRSRHAVESRLFPPLSYFPRCDLAIIRDGCQNSVMPIVFPS